MPSLESGTFEDFDPLKEVEPGLVRLLRKARKPLALLAQTDVQRSLDYIREHVTDGICIRNEPVSVLNDT